MWDNIPDYRLFLERQMKDYYVLQLNRSGPFLHAVGNNRARLIKSPCAWFTGPGLRYRFGTPKGQSRHHSYVSFNGPAVTRFIRGGLAPLTKEPVLLTEPERFFQTMDALFECLGPDIRFTKPVKNMHARARHLETIPDPDMAVYLLEGLFLQLARQPKITANDPSELAIRNLAQAVREKPLDEWDFENESKTLHMSYAHFRRLFRKWIGVPPLGFLRSCRLDWSAMQLRHSNKPIKDIAEEGGFEDIFYFTRIFSSHFHTPPARYRQIFRET
jgi:AraC-like DNA-binding protein